MTPVLEVGHVGFRAVLVAVGIDLAVIPDVADQMDVGRGESCGKVLPVIAAVDGSARVQPVICTPT